MCLSLALVCSEVDGIVVIYLWPPSFAYSKILTRGRYLSRHSRCLRATRVRAVRVDVISLKDDARPATTPSTRPKRPAASPGAPSREDGRRHSTA